jgi:hypothetical protein
MKIFWRESAIKSLLELDNWRATIELPRIALHLKVSIGYYFYNQDYTVHLPGRSVLISKLPIDLRMVLISLGKSDPYKVFFRLTYTRIEIFPVRHPRQKSLK